MRNRGFKYTYTISFRDEAKKENINKEGVAFGEKSNKWLVRIKNKTRSRFVKPFLTVAQFDTKKEAVEYYRKIR